MLVVINLQIAPLLLAAETGDSLLSAVEYLAAKMPNIILTHIPDQHAKAVLCPNSQTVVMKKQPCIGVVYHERFTFCNHITKSLLK